MMTASGSLRWPWPAFIGTSKQTRLGLRDKWSYGRIRSRKTVWSISVPGKRATQPVTCSLRALQNAFMQTIQTSGVGKAVIRRCRGL
jgi:hypothetical protein